MFSAQTENIKTIAARAASWALSDPLRAIGYRPPAHPTTRPPVQPPSAHPSTRNGPPRPPAVGGSADRANKRQKKSEEDQEEGSSLADEDLPGGELDGVVSFSRGRWGKTTSSTYEQRTSSPRARYDTQALNLLTAIRRFEMFKPGCAELAEGARLLNHVGGKKKKTTFRRRENETAERSAVGRRRYGINNYRRPVHRKRHPAGRGLVSLCG